MADLKRASDKLATVMDAHGIDLTLSPPLLRVIEGGHKGSNEPS